MLVCTYHPLLLSNRPSASGLCTSIPFTFPSRRSPSFLTRARAPSVPSRAYSCQTWRFGYSRSPRDGRNTAPWRWAWTQKLPVHKGSFFRLAVKRAGPLFGISLRECLREAEGEGHASPCKAEKERSAARRSNTSCVHQMLAHSTNQVRHLGRKSQRGRPSISPDDRHRRVI